MTLTHNEQDLLIEQHLGQAEAGALAFVRRYGEQRLSRDELRSAAFLGLVEAARSFDTSKGTTFNTYAYQSMNFALRRAYNTWRRQHGWVKQPSVSELAEGKTGMQSIVTVTQWPTLFRSSDDMRIESTIDPSTLPVEPSTPPNQDDAMWNNGIPYILSKVPDPADRQLLSDRLHGKSLLEIATSLGRTKQRMEQRLTKLVKQVQRRIRQDGKNP